MSHSSESEEAEMGSPRLSTCDAFGKDPFVSPGHLVDKKFGGWLPGCVSQVMAWGVVLFPVKI